MDWMADRASIYFLEFQRLGCPRCGEGDFQVILTQQKAEGKGRILPVSPYQDTYPNIRAPPAGPGSTSKHLLWIKLPHVHPGKGHSNREHELCIPINWNVILKERPIVLISKPVLPKIKLSSIFYNIWNFIKNGMETWVLTFYFDTMWYLWCSWPWAYISTVWISHESLLTACFCFLASNLKEYRKHLEF